MIDDRIKSNVREVELPSELFPLVVVVEKGRKVMADHLEPKAGQFFSHQPYKLYCSSHYSSIVPLGKYKHKQKIMATFNSEIARVCVKKNFTLSIFTLRKV